MLPTIGKSRTFFSAGLFAALLISFPLLAPAQVYPDKPVTIYAGFEAGATTDLTARALAEGVQKEMGVSVVVENKPGGNSSVAASLVASKKPDGYTLGVVSVAVTTAPLMFHLSYDPAKDFTYILSYALYPGGICVMKDSPFKTLNDLLEHARKNPGAVSYSSSGMGGTHQLAVELLAREANAVFKHVPFKGGAPACTALIGGHVTFTAGVGLHLTYLKQGVFRMLAVTNADERDPNFPEVPTLKELGYKSAPPSTYTLIAPKGLPDPIFKKLEAACTKAVHSAEFQKRLDSLSVPFAFKNRSQVEAEISRSHEFYFELLKEMGLLKK